MPTLVKPAVHFIRHLLGMCAAIRIGSAILRRGTAVGDGSAVRSGNDRAPDTFPIDRP